MNENEKEVLDSETQEVGGDDNENTSTETEDSEDFEEESEDTSDTEAELERFRRIAEDQRRRAEKAEEKLKAQKAQKPVKQKTQSEQTDALSREEAILYARGLSQEEVEKAKAVAEIEGTNPLVAAESDYFKFWLKEQTEKKETEATQLGASRGSAKVKPKKDFSSPDLSVDEHKALWKQLG
jgi:hypothetical protein